MHVLGTNQLLGSLVRVVLNIQMTVPCIRFNSDMINLYLKAL